jgi:hypothetical protein
MQSAASRVLPPLDQQTMDSLWELFVRICLYWNNLPDVHQYKSRLETFVLNRIANNPQYHLYYQTAVLAINELIAEQGEEKAYVLLFTDIQANTVPAKTGIQIARQYVSNEFVCLQLAVGGFKSFGAVNYCGYFGGPNIRGKKPPYRPAEGI